MSPEENISAFWCEMSVMGTETHSDNRTKVSFLPALKMKRELVLLKQKNIR